jgi:hypothetical protein
VTPVGALTASALLDVADRMDDVGPVDRALLLLRHAGPCRPTPPEDLPIGERDRLLLQLRIDTFGPVAPARTACPDCGTALDAPVHLPALVAASPADPAPRTVAAPGGTVVCRPPTSRDLLALPAGADPGQARAGLLAACTQWDDGGSGPLPPAVAEAVATAMAAADPLLDVQLRLQCAACGASWDDPFDIVAFLCAEIRARAQRLLGEIDELARTYGWSEAEILALGPRRRQRYLALVRS